MRKQDYFQKGEITNAIIELSKIRVYQEGNLNSELRLILEAFIKKSVKFNNTYQEAIEFINSVNFLELENQVKVFNKIKQLNLQFKAIIIDLFSIFGLTNKNSDDLIIPIKKHLDGAGITSTFYFPGDVLKTMITYINYIQLNDERTRLPKTKLYKFDVGDEPFGFTRLSEEVLMINNGLFLEIIQSVYLMIDKEEQVVYKEDLTADLLFRISEFLSFNDFDNLKLYNLIRK
jgi:hypothetical protein